MTTYFYDAKTDTVRRYGHLSVGTDVGERFDKKLADWSIDCCRRQGCKWDEVISQAQAQTILDRQCQSPK